MAAKAIITIRLSHYSESYKDGIEFTSVDLDGHNFGGASPCDTPEQIKSTIAHYIEWCKREKQGWLIQDKRPGMGQQNLF